MYVQYYGRAKKLFTTKYIHGALDNGPDVRLMMCSDEVKAQRVATTPKRQKIDGGLSISKLPDSSHAAA